ncbi:putative Phosphatidate cytidylyltransferase [Candidatus Sulfopaludibacter sp. SbA3]|nr:putative Phosphatidate cytidylyltransferase [Candidatus Sulfopaludibacter sp. SbA3]
MLKRIATALVLIPIVMLLVLRAPVPVVAAVAGAVALITIQEFLKLTESYGVHPLRLPTYIFVGLFFLLLAASAAGETPQLSGLKFVLGVAFACAIASFLFLTITMRRSPMASAYPAAAASAFAFAYVALPMGMLVQLRQQWAGAFWILYLLLIVWAGDIFAYFVGRSLGHHLMASRISPKKTWEGAAASLAASLVVGILLFNHALQISTLLLRIGLIQRRDGEARVVADPTAHHRTEYCRAAWRPGRIFNQTRRRRKGFRNHSSRPRRHARPH